MRTAVRLIPSLTGATVVLIVLLALRTMPITRALSIWVVLLTAITLRELVRRVPANGARRSRFEAALGRRVTVEPVPLPFAAMKRELDLATGLADHAHRRLLPLLRTAADARLSIRHGIELERRPDAARRLLGEPVWELLRPDRPEPKNRLGPGPRREEIAAVIARIEEL